MNQIQVHQYHFGASPGDAITNQMVFLQGALEEAGIGGEIIASRVKGPIGGRVRKFSSLAAWDCDLLLLHHSHGNPDLEKVLRIEVPRALVYHNITPENFYRHDEHVASLCQLGREQLWTLRDRVDVVFADSNFNALELEEMGFAKPARLPLFDLEALERSYGSCQRMRRRDSLQLLFVGRIARHKNQAQLIRLVAELKHFWHGRVRLVIIGSGDPIYLEYLKVLSRFLGVTKEVVFKGKLTNSELRQAYVDSDAFVCASLHEGFCIPLVEAMAAKIPVFALPEGAIAETLGGAGVEWLSRDATQMARSLAMFLENDPFREKILQGQARRLVELKQLHHRKRVADMLTVLVESIRSVPPPLVRQVLQNKQPFLHAP